MSISKIHPELTLEFILDDGESSHFERKSFEVTTSKLSNSII